MFNWADYVDPENIEEFKTRFGITDFTYDIYASNEVLLTRLQGGATGPYDVAAPTAEFVKAMVGGGLHPEARLRRIPNAALINPQFQNFYEAGRRQVQRVSPPEGLGHDRHRGPDEGRHRGRQDVEAVLRGRAEVLAAHRPRGLAGRRLRRRR